MFNFAKCIQGFHGMKDIALVKRRIIQAFWFCVLAILIFAGLSFQAHWEMGKRLRLVNNILEAGSRCPDAGRLGPSKVLVTGHGSLLTFS
jgi:hypothetical protein